MQQKLFVFDAAKCSGCYNCQLACKDEHCGNDWTPYAKPQPDTGHFWLKINEFIQGTVPKVKMHYVPTLCGHCDDAPCLKACAQAAITKREDGLVLIDPAKCNGCKACVAACPEGAVYYNEEESICQKCTGCAHLLDGGEKEPRCVEVCPTGALRFGDRAAFGAELDGAQKRGNAYFLNIPGQFVGGTVFDPEKDEVVIGAICTLRSGDSTLTAVTDDFGDFWFMDLAAAVWTLTIRAPGYTDKTVEQLSTKESVNLGDLPLTR